MEELTGLGMLAEKGILGLLLAGSLWLNWMFYKEIRALSREQLAAAQTNAKDFLAALLASTAAIQAATNAMTGLENIVRTAIDVQKGSRS